MDAVTGYIYVHRTWLNNGVRLDFRWKGFHCFFYIRWAFRKAFFRFFYMYNAQRCPFVIVQIFTDEDREVKHSLFQEILTVNWLSLYWLYQGAKQGEIEEKEETQAEAFWMLDILILCVLGV